MQKRKLSVFLKVTYYPLLSCITSRKREFVLSKNQKLKNVVLFIPDNFSLEEIYSTFENWSHDDSILHGFIKAKFITQI